MKFDPDCIVREDQVDLPEIHYRDEATVYTRQLRIVPTAITNGFQARQREHRGHAKYSDAGETLLAWIRTTAGSENLKGPRVMMIRLATTNFRSRQPIAKERRCGSKTRVGNKRRVG